MKSRRIHTPVLTVLLCLVFLTTNIGHGEMTTRRTIGGSGSIRSGIGKLKFSTDFEDVTWRQVSTVGQAQSEGVLYLKDLNSEYNMHNTVLIEAYSEFIIDDGTRFPNSPVPHSGSKMLCAAIPASTYTTTRRSSLDLKFQRTTEYNNPPQPWLTDQYFLRAWYYFSPDWALNDPSKYNWASICTILNAGSPWQFVLTVRPRTANGYAPLDPVTGYKLCIGNIGEAHTGGPVETTPETWNVSSIRGRWNLLEIFVKNDPNGTNDNHCIVWWDGVKILEGYNFPTLNYQGSEWFVSIPKTYTNCISPANRQWLDDIELWDDIP